MKNTWYLVVLIFALAIVGISMDKSTGANQEIVLKFTEQGVTEVETADVLRFVKSKLQKVTSGEIQIKKNEDGTLKITYYSDIDVVQIKEIFTQNNALLVTTNTNSSEEFPIPNQKELTGYQLDVFEIQNANDFAGSAGTVVEFKTESIRFFTPDVYVFSQQLAKEENTSTKRAYSNYSTIALTIDYSLCVVHQVRAGPEVV